jgi:LPS export ABC transporter protein LptC
MNLNKNIFLILTICFLVSCENSIQVINKITNTKDVPAFSSNDIEVLYSDSAKIRMKIIAKVVNKYTSPEKRYMEFPKGILVYQYDENMNVTSTIKANFAINHENTKIWELRDNVEAKNMLKNEQLNTEELFWEQATRKIYSTKFSKITNADGVFYGDGGFQSKDDLTNWKMIGVKGKVNLKDDENKDDDAQTNP